MKDMEERMLVMENRLTVIELEKEKGKIKRNSKIIQSQEVKIEEYKKFATEINNRKNNYKEDTIKLKKKCDIYKSKMLKLESECENLKLKNIKNFKVPKLKKNNPNDTKSTDITSFKPIYKLFVTNISREVDSVLLGDLFRPFGVEHVEIDRSFAWITFSSKVQAGEAIKKINKTYFYGRQLTVNWSNGKM